MRVKRFDWRRLAATPLVLAGFLAGGTGSERSFTLPRQPAAGDIAWLELEVGPIARGQQIQVRTAQGQMLGAVSPFGVRSGKDAGIYTLPVPAGAIRDRVLSLRVTIESAGVPPRPPTPAELKSLKLHVPSLQP
ncbi:hypothetical protein [Labrys neptuniae]